MTYKILKDCSYSPNGYTVTKLKAGDVVELPDSVGVPFSKKDICEECKSEAEVKAESEAEVKAEAEAEAEAAKKAKLDKKVKAEAEKKEKADAKKK